MVNYEKLNSDEHNELCKSVVDDITDINVNIKNLQDDCELIGTSSDNIDLRNKINDLQDHTKKHISTMTKNFEKLKHAAPKEDKLLQLNIANIEEMFGGVVSKYQLFGMVYERMQKTHPLKSADAENATLLHTECEEQSAGEDIKVDIENVQSSESSSPMAENQEESVDKVHPVELQTDSLKVVAKHEVKKRTLKRKIFIFIVTLICILLKINHSRSSNESEPPYITESYTFETS